MDRYRRAFRKKVIPRHYSGIIHIALFSSIQLSAILIQGIFLEWSKNTLFILLLALMWGTTFTYFLHRFLLHKKLPFFDWAFKMHHWHHTFYQTQNMQYDHIDDIYMLLMPPWIQLLYYLIYLTGLIWVAGFFLSREFALTFSLGLTLWYGIYELVHWIGHLPENHWTMKIPCMEAVRKSHSIHHLKMKRVTNFGIVEPSWDYILGTKS
jgi:hypothetical protein